jgi:nitronate monooxygenase
MERIHWPDDRLCRVLGIETPIIQAPMAGSSTVEMAIAVHEAGGLGSLACATLAPDALRERLQKARDGRADGHRAPFNLNFFAHTPAASKAADDQTWLRRLAPYYRRLGVREPDRLEAGAIHSFDEASCAVVEEIKPEIVSFHFGLPAPDLVDRVKMAGSILMSSATTVSEARWLVARGCDVIIAQGAEAGGHRGMFLAEDVHTQLGTLALVPQIVDAVDRPVVAAGGIADGRGIAAAFALGACGVQIGTAFLLTQEASISPLHLEALRGAEKRGTEMTNLFSGRPARCIVNRTMQEMGAIAKDVASFPFGFSAMAPIRREAEARNSPDFSPHYCGQSSPICSGGVGDGRSASELIRILAEDARRSFERMTLGRTISQAI